MKPLRIAVLNLPLVLPLAAQTTGTTPQAWWRSEAPASAYYLGGFKEARLQFAESYLTGRGAKSLQKVAYRLDYRHSSAAGSGLGKSWSKVSLSLANTSEKRMSKTFTKNQLSTPTQVFSAAVAWPTFSGHPASRPAPFDRTHSFPFGAAWQYDGRYDILLDFKFTGGALLNGRRWSRSEIWKSHILDAPASKPAVLLDFSYHGNPVASRRCTDSRRPAYAYMEPSITVFAQNSGTPFDGKVAAAFASYQTAINLPVVHALSFGAGSSSGTGFPGVTCNPLFVTPATTFLFPQVANASGYAATDFGAFAWNPSFAGVTCWLQAAWEDNPTKALHLSMAAKVVMPARQTPDPLPRSCVYDSSGARSYGLGPYRYEQMNPLIQWTW